MTISPLNATPDLAVASHGVPQTTDAHAGIYAVPVIGAPLRRVRTIADGLQPTADDNLGQVVGKRLVQGAVLAGSAGVMAIAVL